MNFLHRAPNDSNAYAELRLINSACSCTKSKRFAAKEGHRGEKNHLAPGWTANSGSKISRGASSFSDAAGTYSAPMSIDSAVRGLSGSGLAFSMPSGVCAQLMAIHCGLNCATGRRAWLAVELARKPVYNNRWGVVSATNMPRPGRDQSDRATILSVHCGPVSSTASGLSSRRISKQAEAWYTAPHQATHTWLRSASHSHGARQAPSPRELPNIAALPHQLGKRLFLHGPRRHGSPTQKASTNPVRTASGHSHWRHGDLLDRQVGAGCPMG